MEKSVTIAQHLYKLDELIVGLQSLDEPMDEARHLVVFISSLPAAYEIIASTVENAKNVTLMEVKQKLIKEYERQNKKEATERALKAITHGVKPKNERKRSGLKGKCFNCAKFGHIKRDCSGMKWPGENDEDAVFVAGESRSSGWMIDSAHSDVMYVLHIPGLVRRLLSVGKLAERVLNVEFERTSCIIWNKNQATASGKKVGKTYMLECQQETAQYVAYSD
ncbi:unnamed protein product [Peronospora farinosa]|uniref:CCHC-type domain-containing protein n=1 Tax=Peronospora farinosa TaxID=134698 RepID=A0AAV0SZT8_9STRA|nr:unnamed protein product [Peronospora farinosa]